MNEQSQPRRPTYRAMLLRCWRDEATWRFALEDVHTHDKHGFETAEAMLVSLNRWLQETSEQDGLGR